MAMNPETILQLFTDNPKSYNSNLLLPVQNDTGVTGSTGGMRITELLSGVQSTLDFSFPLGGSISATSWDVKFLRIGDFVMMKYESVVKPVTSPGGAIMSTAAFPAGYVPAGAGSFDIVYPVFAIAGATGTENVSGIISLYGAPSLSIILNPLGGTFDGPYAGIRGSSIIYLGE